LKVRNQAPSPQSAAYCSELMLGLWHGDAPLTPGD
jgi:hypothetical protein